MALETLPLGPGLASIEVRSIERALVAESLSGVEQARHRAAHRWEISVVWPRLRAAEVLPIRAFLTRQGRAGMFLVAVPAADPAASGVADMTLAAAAAAGARLVRLTGLTDRGNMTGRYASFSGHAKVYMMTGSPEAGQLSIWPPLRAAVSSGATMTRSGVLFRVRRASEIQEWRHRSGGLVDIAVELREAL